MSIDTIDDEIQQEIWHAKGLMDRFATIDLTGMSREAAGDIQSAAEMWKSDVCIAADWLIAAAVKVRKAPAKKVKKAKKG